MCEVVRVEHGAYTVELVLWERISRTVLPGEHHTSCCISLGLVIGPFAVQ
jgi:hypothetical protein